MASNGTMARRSFRRIWITGKKPFVKRAPEITSADMDMDNPWLACEVWQGVSISMTEKELPRNIESVLW